jgi:chromosome segregation ATPase
LVDEFNWDADEVMEFLGIKRSRLTQISGKELRVARIRRDRYLRPVYREADVRDYQEWTRATATHQSSSRAIETAIDSLDDRFSDILVVLQEKILQYEDRSTALLRQQVHKLDEAAYMRFQVLLAETETQQAIGEGQEKKQNRVLDQLTEHHELLAATQKELQQLRGLLGSFHQDIRTLFVAQQALRREIEASQGTMQEALNQQTASLTSMQEMLSALQTGQKQILQQTAKEAPNKSPKPWPRTGRRPHRQRPRRLSAEYPDVRFDGATVADADGTL